MVHVAARSLVFEADTVDREAMTPFGWKSIRPVHEWAIFVLPPRRSALGHLRSHGADYSCAVNRPSNSVAVFVRYVSYGLCARDPSNTKPAVLVRQIGTPWCVKITILDSVSDIQPFDPRDFHESSAFYSAQISCIFMQECLPDPRSRAINWDGVCDGDQPHVFNFLEVIHQDSRAYVAKIFKPILPRYRRRDGLTIRTRRSNCHSREWHLLKILGKSERRIVFQCNKSPTSLS